MRPPQCASILRRTGNLEKVPEFLTKSEEFVGTRSSLEPGLNFCKGMYEWYAGNPNEALKLFNKARKDHEWGQRAIYNMIEICINPDNQVINNCVFWYSEYYCCLLLQIPSLSTMRGHLSTHLYGKPNLLVMSLTSN